MTGKQNYSGLTTSQQILFWFNDRQTKIILVWQLANQDCSGLQLANQDYSGLMTGKQKANKIIPVSISIRVAGLQLVFRRPTIFQ